MSMFPSRPARPGLMCDEGKPEPTRHLAHIWRNRQGELNFSGYGATGDPSHKPYVAVIDVGRAFQIGTDDGLLFYFDKAAGYQTFSAEGMILAAREELFGFRLLELDLAPRPEPTPEATPPGRTVKRRRSANDLYARFRAALAAGNVKEARTWREGLIRRARGNELPRDVGSIETLRALLDGALRRAQQK